MNKKKLKKFGKDFLVFSMLSLTIIAAIDFYRFKTQVPAELPQNIILQIQSQLPEKVLKNNEMALVYVWGSWCSICSFTSPQVNTLQSSFPVVSIAIKSGNEHQVKNYLKKHQYHFPTLVDEHNLLAMQLGVRGTPAFFMIDGKGKVYYYSIGASTYAGLWLKLFLLDLIK